VIDAYSGVGSIGYYISDQAKKVVMIESNADAISMAQRIKEEKGLQHVEILQGQVETLIQDHQADVLVVDPPRNGLMPELIDTLIAHPFKQMFYLSCDLKNTCTRFKLIEK
jgi:23S rRNA (uracil1939-C5)-methyltransferase